MIPRLLTIFANVFAIARLCNGDHNSNYYCADLTSQPHVDINHLLGIWYGIELIVHKGDREYGKGTDMDCPILHISKGNKTSPDDRNYGHQQHGFDVGYNSDDDSSYSYDREANVRYANDNSNNRGRNRYRVGDPAKQRQAGQMRKLNLYLSDNGRHVTYYLTYNESKAGFWMSSGPHNGSALERRFDHLAGTVQVLKAVGSHLVLVFCYRMPDKRLYTLLVSREQNLSQHEIHGVHNLLMRRDLTTLNATRLCANGGVASRMDAIVVVGLLMSALLLALV